MSETTDLADILRGLKAIKRLIDGETRGIDPTWIDQANSPLGRRIHIEAAKRRFAEAEAKGIDARQLGVRRDKRRYLLSQESMAEELGNREARGVAKARERKAANDQARAEEDASPAYLEALAAMQHAVSRGR